MIAELSAAIDEKTVVKEKVTETVANLDRESIRLTTELEKMKAMTADGKIQKDVLGARVHAEVTLLERDVLLEFVKEDEVETEVLRERVEALKRQVETLGDQERQIRLSIAEERAAVDAKSKETEVSAAIIQLRQDLEQDREQLNRLQSTAEKRRSKSDSHRQTLERLRARKEEEKKFPAGCPKARAMQKDIESKQKELVELNDCLRKKGWHSVPPTIQKLA